MFSERTQLVVGVISFGRHQLYKPCVNCANWPGEITRVDIDRVNWCALAVFTDQVDLTGSLEQAQQLAQTIGLAVPYEIIEPQFGRGRQLVVACSYRGQTKGGIGVTNVTEIKQALSH